MHGMDRKEYRDHGGMSYGKGDHGSDSSYLYGNSFVAFAQRDERIFRFLLVPAAGFVAVTILRKLIAAKRPYEIYGFTPLLQKDTRANSFPSRHVFSNMIIAAAALYVNLPLGIFTAVCGLLLAVLRVITGVHFRRMWLLAV